MDGPGREPAVGSDAWPRPERKGGWGPAIWPLAGDGASRRLKAVRNPGSCASPLTTPSVNPGNIDTNQKEPQEGATDG